MDARRLTVLIVDDTPSARDLLVAALGAEGHRTYTAPGVAEALRILQAGPPFDLILSDYSMPPATGADLLKAVRADGRLGRLPVFMISGETDPLIRARTETLGANGWLPKPVCIRTLLSVVAAVARMAPNADAEPGAEPGVGIPTYRAIHR